MLTIRLQRAGKRNTPQYKVVLAEKTAANQKKFIEVIGAYNPHSKELVIRDQERLNYWINDQHVELSPTVHNLFVTKELIKADKKRAFAIPPKAEEPKAEEAPEETKAEEATSPEAAVEESKEETPVEPAPEVKEADAEPVVPEAPAEETVAEAPAETPTEESK